MGALWEGVLLWIRMGDSGVLCCKRGENCHGLMARWLERWSNGAMTNLAPGGKRRQPMP
jgi:hypothetical protein